MKTVDSNNLDISVTNLYLVCLNCPTVFMKFVSRLALLRVNFNSMCAIDTTITVNIVMNEANSNVSELTHTT